VSAMRIEADLTRCIGAGQCVLNASPVFSQDEDTGLVVVHPEMISNAEREAIENAVYACPTRALTLHDR
jgi:ferredoxin